MANRGGFSWKRYLGITKAKRRISKATGIPWTKSGRQQKVGKMVTGGGCAIPVFAFVTAFIAVIVFTVSCFAHPGNTDSSGGHAVSADSWGYEIGTYHVHDRNGAIVPVDKETLIPTEITVSVNGERIIFDQKPVNIDGRVLVPVRYVVEKLGCSVEWSGDTQTVYVVGNGQRGTVTDADGIEVVVNGEMVAFDVPPQNINGRVLIPIRAVVEKLGCTVEWDGTLQTVYIVGSNIENSLESQKVANSDADIEVKYVLNTNTRKFHDPSCASAIEMKEQNRQNFKGSRDELIHQGYAPCGRCNP